MQTLLFKIQSICTPQELFPFPRFTYRLQVEKLGRLKRPSRERKNYRGGNEKNNGPRRLRASAHDAINRRPSRRISFTLATHSTHSRTVRFCGEGKRFTLRWRKLAASFFSSVTNPSIQASPRLTKDWLSLIEPATPTLFKLSSFPFLVSLFAKVIEHPDRDVRF